MYVRLNSGNTSRFSPLGGGRANPIGYADGLGRPPGSFAIRFDSTHGAPPNVNIGQLKSDIRNAA
jgi:hypothetical protein